MQSISKSVCMFAVKVKQAIPLYFPKAENIEDARRKIYCLM